MVTKTDYSQRAVAAAESALLELTHLLGEYRDNIVLVGGLVPRYLIPGAEEPHIGSTDIDLALEHRHFDERGYKTVHDLLTGRGYKQDTEQPFIYRKEITVEGSPITVQVDLLSGEYGGTGKSRRTQKVQDIRPRKARGADIAFERPLEVEISGHLPGGGKDKVTVRIPGIVPFLVMKAMAMHDRLKEKDAYDIYYCLRHYPGGPQSIAAEFDAVKKHGLVREALVVLSERFESLAHVGPVHIAAFLEITDPDEQQRIRRDAFERASILIGILSPD